MCWNDLAIVSSEVYWLSWYSIPNHLNFDDECVEDLIL